MNFATLADYKIILTKIEMINLASAIMSFRF